MNEAQRKLLKQLEASFYKGQVIFEEGDNSRELYILLNGEVEIKKGGTTIAIVKEPDSYLGEMSTLLGTPRTATMVAASDCLLIRVPESKVTDFFAHSPSLGIKLAKTIAVRLQEMNDKYQKLFEDGGGKPEEVQPIFDKLVQDAHHRAFLKFYRQKVGSATSVKEIVSLLEIPISDLNSIFMNFGMAGLVQLEGKSVKLNPAPTKALAQMIDQHKF
jgi:CRP-like cAMP-binding protein